MARVLASDTMSDPIQVQAVYDQLRNYGSGANICYAPSLLVSSHEAAKQFLATQLKLGMRFPSHQVLKMSNRVPVESQSLLKSDGRWRLLVFAGDTTNPTQLQRVNKLGEQVGALQKQFRSIRKNQGYLEILLFYHGRADQMELSDFHPAFSSLPNVRNGYDHDRIFADPPASVAQGRYESAHVAYDIGIGRGCMVVTRPDQCVGWVGDLDDSEQLGEYFARFML